MAVLDWIPKPPVVFVYGGDKVKEIKTKQTDIKQNTVKPKTASTPITHKPTEGAQRQFVADKVIKTKEQVMHTQQPQTQSPENYATDRVERAERQTAYNTADTARRSAVKAKNMIKQRQAQHNADIPKQPNAPKTRELVTTKPNDAPMPIKSKEALQKQAAMKAQTEKILLPEHTPKTREYMESREVMKPSEAQTVKAKEQSVIKAKQQAAVKAKADKTEPMRIKTREEYMKAHSSTPTSSNHIQPKTVEAVKSKAETARVQAAKKDLARKTTIDKFKDKRITETKTQETAYSNATGTAAEAIPQNKPAIKTKEAYIKSRANVKQTVSSQTTPNTQKSVSRMKTASQKLTKFRNNQVKSAQAVTKQSKRAARHAARQAAKRTRQAKAAAKATGKTITTTTKLTAKAAAVVTKATTALISGLAAAGGAGILLVILIVICIIAAIAGSPFGIFISGEVNDAGTIPLSQIIAEYNVELTQEVENIETSVAHDEVEVVDAQSNTNLVLAVFAVKTAGTDNNTAEDVVVFDDEKAEKLKTYFRAANTVSYEVTETTVSEGETKKKLTITVTGKTKDELITQYALTAKQKEALETLLEHGDVLTGASQSLAITDANVQAIVAGLPNSLPQKRKDVVKNAATLVGKVNYFWGGKSSAIGWDSAWGSMQRVTAAGSPSSGSIRSYGLDCSGYVTWAFNNSGMYVGDGTFGQRDRSVVVSASSVQAGDLCFLPSYSHVGIVVGRDAGGNILVFHCSSSANNVVLSTASSVGFTVFRRPNCY